MNSSNIVIISSKNDAVIHTVGGKVSKIRNGNTSPIKYIIFSYYAQFAKQLGETDLENMFNNASRGSFMKGFKFTEDKFLLAKTSSGVQKINIIPPSVEYFQSYYYACKEFINKASSVFNTADDDSEFVYLPSSKREETGWSGNISASRQVTMITAYANEMGIKYNLTEEKVQELISNITGKIFIGDLCSSDMHCQGLSIVSIEGLTFSDPKFPSINGKFYITSKPAKEIKKQRKRTTTTTTKEEVKDERVFKSSAKLSIALKRRYGDASYCNV